MKTALIFAAGRGERMQPLTYEHPKALCLVHGRPLLSYHLQHLVEAGFERVVINHAYLGGHIRRYLGKGEAWGIDICYVPEPPGALESGGGLFNALPLLGTEPFITINADIFTDYPFKRLTLADHQYVHLVLVKAENQRTKADFGISTHNELLNTDRQYIFTGIACYHPQSFKDAKPGRYSIVPNLRKWVEQKRVSHEVYDGAWNSLETPGELYAINYSN